MFTPETSTFIWDCVWQSSLWLALGGLASRFWRDWPARAHRVMVLALLGCLATPFLSLVVRRSGWGLLSRPTPGMVRYFDSESVPEFGPHLGGRRSPAPTQSTESLSAGAPHSITPAPIVGDSPKPKTVNGAAKGLFSPLGWFVGAWTVLSAGVLVRLIFSSIRELSMLRRARPVTEPKVREALDQALMKLNLRGAHPKICGSDRIRCPVVFCWGRRPTLLLPVEGRSAGLQSGVSPMCHRQSPRHSQRARSDRRLAGCNPAIQQIENLRYDIAPFAPQELEIADLVGLLTHELAHWKRRDHWAALLGQLAVCVLPWQPLLWWAKRRLEHLSELACDHWVLASGQPAEAYAESLLNLVPQRDATLALPAVKHRSKLENRIRRILGVWRPDPKLGRKWSSFAAACSICLASAFALLQAQTTLGKRDKKDNDSEVPKSAAAQGTRSNRLVVTKLMVPDQISKMATSQQVEISPDGRKVAAIADENYSDIKVTDLSDQSVIRVDNYLRKASTNKFELGAFSWSRDSEKLAFAYYSPAYGRSNQISLRVLSLGTGALQTIYESREMRITPSDWTRDGKWILATVEPYNWQTNGSRFILVSTDGGQPREIKSNGRKHKLSPDGKWIAFERRTDGRSVVFLRTIEGSDEISIGPTNQWNFDPLWSSDGRWLLFKSNRGGAYYFWANRVENGKPSGNSVPIKTEVEQRMWYELTLNDGRLVYSKWSPGFGVYRVSVNPDTGEVVGTPRRITAGREGIPSPDGTKVVHTSFDAGSGSGSILGLRVVSIDGTEVPIAAADVRNPIAKGWFPDGNSVLFRNQRFDGTPGLLRLDLKTGNIEPVWQPLDRRASGALNSWPADGRVSADGQLVAMGPTGPIYVIKLGLGGEPIPVYRPATNEYLRSPTWSPDGSRIAFFSVRRRAPPIYRILTISATGGEPRELVRNDHGPASAIAWSPNGKFIVYYHDSQKEHPFAESDRNELWIVPVAGGEPVHLSSLDRLSGAGSMFAQSPLGWSPDSSELFFSGYDDSLERTEYWTLENYLPEEKRAGL